MYGYEHSLTIVALYLQHQSILYGYLMNKYLLLYYLHIHLYIRVKVSLTVTC